MYECLNANKLVHVLLHMHMQARMSVERTISARVNPPTTSTRQATHNAPDCKQFEHDDVTRALSDDERRNQLALCYRLCRCDDARLAHDRERAIPCIVFRIKGSQHVMHSHQFHAVSRPTNNEHRTQLANANFGFLVANSRSVFFSLELS